MSRALRWLLAAVGWGIGPAAAQPAAPQPADTFERAFDAYHRIELLVAPTFRADCAPHGLALRCTVRDAPEGFYRTLVKLEGGVVADVRLVGRAREGLVVEIERRSPEVVLLQARLEGPPRWVIEAGAPAVMGTAVEDEHPFRPYPLPRVQIEAALPPPRLEPLPGGSAEAEAYDDCFRSWRRHEAEAADRCREVAEKHAATDAGRLAQVVRAEVLAERAATDDKVPVEDLTAALDAAEQAASTPLDRVRYALLAERLLRQRALPEKAELLLEGRAGTYQGTAAEPYVTIARAGMALTLGDRPRARKLLESLRDRPADTPGVGQALRALACLAYEDRAWTEALGLFEAVRVRWPEQLSGDAGAQLRAAELYFLYGRLDEAGALYADLPARFPTYPEVWVAKVRLAMLKAYQDPEGARKEFLALAESLGEQEGQDLARVQAARLSDRTERLKVLWQLHRSSPTDYVAAEVLVDLAREALYEGRLREAFDELKELWSRMPDDVFLQKAPLLFDRVLYLLARAYLDHGRPRRLVSLYYRQRKRFESNRRPDLMHLLVGRALRRIGLPEEALSVLQRGLRGDAERAHPDDAARVYLEMAAALREFGDAFRLRQILEYLDRTHPGGFDEYEYWMSKGMNAWWSGRLEEARDVFRYALNGPATPEQRVELAGRIADVYVALKDWPKAVRALEARLTLDGEAGGAPNDAVQRDARWRIAELQFEAAQWPDAVAALQAFLDHHADDPARTEAIFLMGRALERMGDLKSAAREWDRVVHEGRNDTWTHLAKKSLDSLRWRQDQAPAVARAALGTSAP